MIIYFLFFCNLIRISRKSLALACIRILNNEAMTFTKLLTVSEVYVCRFIFTLRLTWKVT